MIDERTPVLFLHAFPLTGDMWSTQVRDLPTTRPTFAPTLAGFGGTALPDHAITFEYHVDSMIEFLKKSGVAKSIWCGLSMGGYLALRMYENAPELCAGLVLCDTKAGADDNAGKLKRADAIKAAVENREEFVEGQCKALVGESSRKNGDLMNQVRNLMLKTDSRGMTSGLAALATRTDSLSMLEKITVPTLIIVGSEDAVTPPAEAEKLKAGIRGSRLVVIEEVGHLSNLEAPEEFNRALKGFLEARK